MSSFALYVIGYFVLICGLSYGAHLAGVPDVWIGVGAIIMLGIGIITGVSRARRPDTPPSSAPIERERVVERTR